MELPIYRDRASYTQELEKIVINGVMGILTKSIADMDILDKWTNVSPNRFSNLTIATTGLSVDLRGAVGEKVSVTAVVDGVVVVRDVWIGPENTATLTVRRRQ